MKPRRNYASNHVLSLPGGTEDNDLFVTVTRTPHGPTLTSVWEPTDEERAAIARGENIALVIFGPAHPPVQMMTTSVPLGRAPRAHG